MEAVTIENVDHFVIARRRMVEEQLMARDICDPRILEAFSTVKRHLFVPTAMRGQSYGDYPLAIGHGQTISQPYIVARMIQSLGLKGGEKLLEIGTGCGYQTALLARLVSQVCTIERIKELGLDARKILKHLGYKNIVMAIGDGSQGWEKQSPYDVIIVAAGSPQVPEPLFQQLSEGGKMIVPIGEDNKQDLTLVTKIEGQKNIQSLGACRFVRLVGHHGWGKPPVAGNKFAKRSLV